MSVPVLVPPAPITGQKRSLAQANSGAGLAPALHVGRKCKVKKVVPACHIEVRIEGGAWFTPVAQIDVVVGERVRIRVVPDGGAILANPVWTFSNNHVGGYTAMGTNTAPVAGAVVTPTVTHVGSTTVYWTSAGAQTAQLNVNINGAAGNPVNDNVAFNVVAPNIVTARVRENVIPRVRTIGPDRFYALSTGGLTGVSMRFRATTNPCGVRHSTGHIAGFQLVNSPDYHVADTRQVAWNYVFAGRVHPPNAPAVGQPYMKELLAFTGGAYMLDTVAPYANAVALNHGATATWDATDSPAGQLHDSLTKLFVDTRFQVYFMFKSAQANSIWVPMWLIPWRFRGTVQRAALHAGVRWIGAAIGAINNALPAAAPHIIAGAVHHVHPTWAARIVADATAFHSYSANPHA